MQWGCREMIDSLFFLPLILDAKKRYIVHTSTVGVKHVTADCISATGIIR